MQLLRSLHPPRTALLQGDACSTRFLLAPLPALMNLVEREGHAESLDKLEASPAKRRLLRSTGADTIR